MKKMAEDILPRPHELHRRARFEHRLAGIRIYYTVFYLGVLFAAQKYLPVSLATLIIFSFLALIYGFIRYFKPAEISEERRFPPLADWFDILFIAVLIYLNPFL